MSDEFHLGFLFGLLVGEGSFTGDKSKGRIDVKMHVRHEALLRSLQGRWGGRLYGAYEHDGRHYVIWRFRGADLNEMILRLDDNLHRIPDEKTRDRFLRLKRQYGLAGQEELFHG